MSSVQRRLLGCNAQNFSLLMTLAEQRDRNFLALENVVEQCWVTIDDVHVRVRETTQRLAVILRQAMQARRVVAGLLDGNTPNDARLVGRPAARWDAVRRAPGPLGIGAYL